MITHSIEINRRPEDVLAYFDDVERHGEWQSQITGTRLQTEGPVRVGARVRETRKIGGREQDTSYEITEHDPPRKTALRGIAGPVRPVATLTVNPAGDGSKALAVIEFHLVGHGWGKLIAPLARLQARKTIEENQAQLKARLEAGA